MTAFLIAMTAGFAGSFHCVGMCGGFACGLSQMHTGSKSALLLRSLLYNLGRLVTYAFIGALAGTFGAALTGGGSMVLSGEMGVAQRLLSAAAGVLMLIMALELFGIRKHMPKSWGRIGGEGIAGIFRSLLLSRNPSAPLVLGVANGFLPCPLVLAFAAISAATGSVELAILTMIAFGLGTFPSMIFMSMVGVLMSPAIRVWGVRVAGTFVLVIGLVTLARGLLPGLIHGAGHAMHMT